MTRDVEAKADERRERRGYVIGAALSVALTMLGFGSVWAGLGALAYWIIGLAGFVQIVVQLRCFLHIDLSRQKREDLQLILFSSLLLGLMVAGTIWILHNQDKMMMPGMAG